MNPARKKEVLERKLEILAGDSMGLVTPEELKDNKEKYTPPSHYCPKCIKNIPALNKSKSRYNNKKY